MIFSAGAGSRLRPLSLVRPKPLFQVLNKTMLEWWAEFLSSAGVKRLIINVHYQPELMLERIQRMSDSSKDRLEIIPSLEETVLGTGGGLKKAAPLLGSSDFLVVNADIFTDFELVKLSLKHLANPGRLATLGLLDQTDKANVSLGPGGRILGFRYPQALPEEVGRQAYCGVMALSPAIFDLIPDGPSDIIDVFNQALTRGQKQMIADEACSRTSSESTSPPGGVEIFGWTYDPAIWQDMGTAEDYWDLNRRLAAGRAIIHSTAQARGHLSGWNVLGAESRVEEGATVENSVLWPQAVVSPGAVVKNAVISGLVPPGLTVDGGVFCDVQGC